MSNLYSFDRKLTDTDKAKMRDKYDLTIKKINQYENREIDKKHKEYGKLNDYSKRCLVATNYWRVMWGDNFIDVPTKDIRFWYYFDPKCFDLAPEWQRTKRPDFIERNKELEVQRLLNESNKIEVKDVVSSIEPERKIEIKEPEIIEKPKIEEMPIEENKDFLNQKREHPIYPKRENVVIKSDSENKPIDEKLIKSKKGKKDKPKNEDTQGSLF